jgi:peptide chain release factor 3
MARWVTSSKESSLKDFIKQNSYRVAEDAVNAPAFLASHGSELNIAIERWPDIEFHALREHSGLIFQAGLAA